jgi:hypothetical protein
MIVGALDIEVDRAYPRGFYHFAHPEVAVRSWE